jgi:hypothetical protein
VNRAMRRLSEKNGRKLQKKAWDDFKQVNPTTLEGSIANPESLKKYDAVLKNNKYMVFVNKNRLRNGRRYTKVMVRRSDAQPIYSWQDLYRIKNEIFGEEVEAVQFMPKVSELIDDANMYWFWIEE